MNDADLKLRIESLEARQVLMWAALEEAERFIASAGNGDACLTLIRQALGSVEAGAHPDDSVIRLNLGRLSITVPPKHGGGAVPLLIKYHPDDAPNAWATSDGSAVYLTREWAEKADYMKTDEYRENIRNRSRALQLVKAQVVEDYDGWVTTTGDEDDYAACIADLLEKHGDRLSWAGVSDENIPSQLPAWAYCCTEDGFDFDIEDAIRTYLDDNHHEDAADWIKDWKGLDVFWAAWVAKQKDLRSYMIDYQRIVVIDRGRYEAELAEAKAYLETAR